MQASLYLRMQLDRDRDLALAVQHGFTGAFNTAKGIISDVYSGIERASWYTSCLIPDYQDVCRNLGHEDARTLYSIASLFTKHDALEHVFYLYFEYVYGDIQHGNPQTNPHRTPYETVQKAKVSVAGLAAKMSVARATRYGFATALSESLSNSGLLTRIVAERATGYIPFTMAVFQTYGLQQHMALAARHLHSIESRFYDILYRENIEMLYYFVAPILSEIINKVHSGEIHSLEEMIDEVNDIKGRPHV